MAIFLYILMVSICLKRNLGTFIKLVSYGSISILCIAIFILAVGVFSWGDTDFVLLPWPKLESRQVTDEAIRSSLRVVYLFNTNFSSLAGVFGMGYCLHPMTVEIMRHNQQQQHNARDLSIGYFIVFVAYTLIGTVGYFGFLGLQF